MYVPSLHLLLLMVISTPLLVQMIWRKLQQLLLLRQGIRCLIGCC